MIYKALSVAPVFADRIMSGEKKIEKRTWQTDYRGDLLICATTKKESKYLVSGYALGVVDLYNITKTEKGYNWYLRNPRFIVPVAVKGKLHLFDVAIDAYNEPTKCNYDDAVLMWYDLNLIVLDELQE